MAIPAPFAFKVLKHKTGRKPFRLLPAAHIFQETGPGVVLRPGYYPGFDRVEVDIAGKLQQTFLGFNKDRCVSPLEQTAGPFPLAVEVVGVGPVDAAHDL
jgi:hypothetical protein